MLIRFKSQRKAKYLKIDNYKELTALQVIMELNGYLLGRHFEDGVKTVWHEEGLKLGSMKGELKQCRY